MKRSRVDLEPTVAYLWTRLSKSNMDYWKKLKILLGFFNRTLNDVIVIE